MVKKLIRKSVNRTQWRQYFAAAEENYQGALNNYKAGLWTPAAILIVHAAIAYTDALTIKAGSVKSSSEDHFQVVDLIKQVLTLSKEESPVLNRLTKILSEKSKAAYGGKIYSPKQVAVMMKHFSRYRSWIIRKIEMLA